MTRKLCEPDCSRPKAFELGREGAGVPENKSCSVKIGPEKYNILNVQIKRLYLDRAALVSVRAVSCHKALPP